MTKYLAGVLTVIAVGVLLIAYGLLAPRAVASPFSASASELSMPAYASVTPAYARAAPARFVPAAELEARPIQTSVTSLPGAPSPRPRRAVDARSPSRDWKRTALIVGGSSATGAGLGAIFGGKKGALIGAALGGGASTIYETTRH